MPKPDLSQLQNELLRAGISPRHVRRTVDELSDHFEDLVEHALIEKNDIQAAKQRALDELGDYRDIANAIRLHPEFRCWALRFPRLALVLYPLTYFVLNPVMVGVNHAADLARWMTCIFLGGAATAAIFLFMQLSIALT